MRGPARHPLLGEALEEDEVGVRVSLLPQPLHVGLGERGLHLREQLPVSVVHVMFLKVTAPWSHCAVYSLAFVKLPCLSTVQTGL